MAEAAAKRLSALDVAIVTIGIVIGAGIFRVPSAVAGVVLDNGGTGLLLLGLWAIGALAALAGALVYAELSSRFPSMGGEYHILRLAWGPKLAGLFLWARIAIIQTGSIATVAFVAGDYAVTLWPGGPSPALWAGLAVAGVTLFNLAGIHSSRNAQRLLVGVVLAALAAVVVAALVAGGGGVAPGEGVAGGGGIGLALVFVMLAYGGWNEAAYLSAEVRGGPRAMLRALVLGVGAVALIYLIVNAALLWAFGLEGLATTAAPAAAVMESAFGPAAGAILTIAVVAASLSTINATTITGARAMCAAGNHLPGMGMFARWDGRRSVPVAALLVQGAVALALTAYGATARDGFSAMVAFGAPVFWLFLSLVALSLFRLREGGDSGGFRVPFGPIIPLIFLGACLYMLWSGIEFARFMLTSSDGGELAGVLGVVLLAAGIPLAWKARS